MSFSTGMESSHYYVLLALANEPSHGYAITDQIVADTVGGIVLRPSTLYFVLKSLEKQGLIERWGRSEHLKRVTYRLTELGTRKLATEARTQERAARLAKKRLGLRD